MDSDSNNDNAFYASLPNDAPPELKTLAQNIGDMLSSISNVRGKEYGTLCTLFLGLLQSVLELEEIACIHTRLLSEAVPDSDSGHETYKIAHTMSHLHCQNALKIIEHFASFCESRGFTGIRKDIESLMDRVSVDWKSKQEGH